jgi:hypothetical protein
MTTPADLGVPAQCGYRSLIAAVVWRSRGWLVVKQDDPAYPIDIGMLGSDVVMFDADLSPHAIKQAAAAVAARERMGG